MATTGSRTQFDPAMLEVLWSRLHGVTEEMWNTILRTSFSTIIGAALDYGVAVLDAGGGQLVHASGSMPLFNLSLPTITRDLLRRYEGRIYPGDVFIGNDPWLCCGHLPDVAIMTPVYRDTRLVAFATNVGHQADFGGAHGHKRVREVYDEGLFLPVMKLYERGQPNETLFEVIRSNVRVSDMVLGDIEAQVSANQVGARRLLTMLEEYKLDDPADPNGQTLSDLVAELQERSERAMRAIIRALPDGTSRVEGLADCQGRPVKMCLTLTIKGDEIIADYEGTEPQLEFGGLNCTMSYTTGDTHYALKCALAPHIPHNEGSTKPLQVLAPEGSILNATFPASVNARTYTGWHLYSLIYAALAELVPDKAMASPGLLQFPRVVGTYPDGKEFNAPIFAGGGRGGSNVEDGIGGFIFPSSASTVSVEVFETASPAMIAFKEWLPDTAGAGKHRGGPAQRITIRKLHGYEPPVRIRYAPIRGVVPGPGLFGGKDGSLDNPTWNGQPITPELEIGRDGWSSFRDQDDTLTFEVPSGGGYGDPGERDPALIERDIELGFVTREGARRDYGYEPEG